jgi:hypothetical protein
MTASDWDDEEEDEDEPPTEERAAALEALEARVRERLGEHEWRRLSRRLLITRVITAGWGLAFVAAAWLMFGLALGGVVLLLMRLATGSWRLPMDFVRQAWYLALAVGVGGVFVALDYPAQASLRRALAQHSEEGEDQDELRDALWARSEARSVRRRLAERQREAAAEARLLQEIGVPPSRWRLELSGAYLVWWLCAAFWLAWLTFHWPLSDRLLESIGVITATGLLFRLILLAVLRGPRQRYVDRLGTMRFSWWWGRGWLPMLLALLPGAAYWGAARVLGWR